MYSEYLTKLKGKEISVQFAETLVPNSEGSGEGLWWEHGTLLDVDSRFVYLRDDAGALEAISIDRVVTMREFKD